MLSPLLDLLPLTAPLLRRDRFGAGAGAGACNAPSIFVAPFVKPSASRFGRGMTGFCACNNSSGFCSAAGMSGPKNGVGSLLF